MRVQAPTEYKSECFHRWLQEFFCNKNSSSLASMSFY